MPPRELSAHELQQQHRAERQARAKAIRDAKTDGERTAPTNTVTVRILPLGDGMVSTGEHVAGMGDVTFEHRDTTALALTVAEELQRQGYAEILDEAPPAAEAAHGVEIPDGWSNMPFLSLAALARKIDPTLPKTADAGAARAVILAEIDRRTKIAGDADDARPSEIRKD